MTHFKNDILDQQAYLARRAENEKRLGDAGIYDPQMEHDNCGVGFVAAVDGKPSRAVVDAAIEALQSIWHRGAVDADGMTGDGAGIHIAIPRDFFIEHIARTGHKDDGVFATPRFERTRNLPLYYRTRNFGHGLCHLWLASSANRHKRAWPKGDGHTP